MDEFHENSLILEDIALCLKVEVVIEMSIDFLVLAILLQESSQDSHPPNPKHFDRHSGVCRSLPFSGTGVSALTSGLSILTNAGSRVDGHWLSNNKSVFNQFTDVLSGVGVCDLIAFVGV